MTDSKKPAKPTKADADDDDVTLDDDEKSTPLLLAELVGQYCTKPKYSDVGFVVRKDAKSEPQRIPAHRIILAASSPIFEAMLYPVKSDSSTPVASATSGRLEIKVDDCDPETFNLLLQCIYTDEIVVTTDNVTELMSLARRYQVDKLQVLCADFLTNDLSIENALNMYVVAPDLVSDPDFGIDFIAENMEELLETDGFVTLPLDRLIRLLQSDKLEVEEVLLFKAVQKWAVAELKRQGKSTDISDVRNILTNVLPLIRFPTMEMEHIASVVAPSQLLGEQQLLELFTYNSMTEERLKEKIKVAFPTQPREGGGLAKDSKLLARKYKKDVLGFFGPKARVQLKLLFRGSKDGFNAGAFHSKCNNQGATLTVVKAQNRPNIFGGYTSMSWSSSNTYLQCECWLFSLVSSGGKPIKFVSAATTNAAYDNPGYGPTWGGGHDLHINSNMQSNSNYSSPSNYTQAAPGYTGFLTQETLAGSYNFMVEEIEVFKVIKKS